MSSRGSELRNALAHHGGFRGVVREQVAMAPYTHIRIGGPAQFFAEPSTEEDVALMVRVCRELSLPLRVLGGGSNLVVSDAGVDGVVMTLGNLNRLVRDKDRITAGAGVTLPSLIRSTKDVGLAGLEVLIGIPAHVGGAVAMNAGTKDGETFDRLVSLAMVTSDGEIVVWGKEQMTPKYRDGGLGAHIVLHATWELAPDDPRKIFSRLEQSLRRRNATQPVTEKSVGCVFTNPKGDSAGRLIEEAGCKMLRHGGLQVSGKHANYFVNDGTGTSAEFLSLMGDVQRRVRERFSVELQAEVKVWGAMTA